MSKRVPSVMRSGAFCRPLGALLLTLVALPCTAAEPPLPAELAFLPRTVKSYDTNYEPWTEMQLPGDPWGGDGVGKVVRGKHWEIHLAVAGKQDSATAWTVMKPAFLGNGWVAVREWTSGGLELFLHYSKGGVEAWGELRALGAERALVNVVEIAPMPFPFTLAPPAAAPEAISPDTGDFPYLQPLLGSRLSRGVADPAPFSVTVKGAGQAEVVATGSVSKVYAPAPGLSNSLFRIAYHDALTKAGWVIVDERQSADVLLSAHYAQAGRNIWATLHLGGDRYEIRVADAGAATRDLASDLAKDCHVALYGVLFDFNKSTLQPVSEPVLQKVLALLTKDAGLKLEIQGHTDNVGNDAYNQTLSEARAGAVVAWLAQHGVAAGRLTAKGYGRTMPIADNRTDEGRAKNRRVEIADPRCGHKGK